MSSLADRFSMRIRIRVTSAQGETTPGSEAPGGKHPKRSGLNEEVQKNLKVIILNSLERAFYAFLALESAA